MSTPCGPCPNAGFETSSVHVACETQADGLYFPAQHTREGSVGHVTAHDAVQWPVEHSENEDQNLAVPSAAPSSFQGPEQLEDVSAQNSYYGQTGETQTDGLYFPTQYTPAREGTVGHAIGNDAVWAVEHCDNHDQYPAVPSAAPSSFQGPEQLEGVSAQCPYCDQAGETQADGLYFPAQYTPEGSVGHVTGHDAVQWPVEHSEDEYQYPAVPSAAPSSFQGSEKLEAVYAQDSYCDQGGHQGVTYRYPIVEHTGPNALEKSYAPATYHYNAPLGYNANNEGMYQRVSATVSVDTQVGGTFLTEHSSHLERSAYATSADAAPEAEYTSVGVSHQTKDCRRGNNYTGTTSDYPTVTTPYQVERDYAGIGTSTFHARDEDQPLIYQDASIPGSLGLPTGVMNVGQGSWNGLLNMERTLPLTSRRNRKYMYGDIQNGLYPEPSYNHNAWAGTTHTNTPHPGHFGSNGVTGPFEDDTRMLPQRLSIPTGVSQDKRHWLGSDPSDGYTTSHSGRYICHDGEASTNSSEALQRGIKKVPERLGDHSPDKRTRAAASRYAPYRNLPLQLPPVIFVPVVKSPVDQFVNRFRTGTWSGLCQQLTWVGSNCGDRPGDQHFVQRHVLFEAQMWGKAQFDVNLLRRRLYWIIDSPQMARVAAQWLFRCPRKACVDSSMAYSKRSSFDRHIQYSHPGETRDVDLQQARQVGRDEMGVCRAVMQWLEGEIKKHNLGL